MLVESVCERCCCVGGGGVDTDANRCHIFIEIVEDMSREKSIAPDDSFFPILNMSK